jgi:hypothetical protein
MTFPGVIMHEYAHARACRWLGIRVIKTCYLRFGNPLGYVIHERPPYTIQHILVAVAPFFISTGTALLISTLACCLFAGTLSVEYRDSVTIVSVWLAFSVALHAFPSSGDADSLWDDVCSSSVGLFPKLMLVPVVALIRLTGLGARLWLDALFAICVVALPPLILLSFFA